MTFKKKIIPTQKKANNLYEGFFILFYFIFIFIFWVTY
jgi:hypothetical protein